MTSRLNPYITFPNTTREAMAFYREVLGGDLAISTFADFGGARDGVDPDGVMHARLDTPLGFTLMASDAALHAIPDASRITLSISGDDADVLRGYFAGLMDGGSVQVPLSVQSWGDEFGMGTDRFGVSWMVNITGAA
jgi:PhnB protein